MGFHLYFLVKRLFQTFGTMGVRAQGADQGCYWGLLMGEAWVSVGVVSGFYIFALCFFGVVLWGGSYAMVCFDVKWLGGMVGTFPFLGVGYDEFSGNGC